MRIKTLLLVLILAAGTPFASLAEAATTAPAAQKNPKIDRALKKKLDKARKKAKEAEKEAAEKGAFLEQEAAEKGAFLVQEAAQKAAAGDARRPPSWNSRRPGMPRTLIRR